MKKTVCILMFKNLSQVLTLFSNFFFFFFFFSSSDLAANWDSCLRCNCLQHGLTVHTTYEVMSPYPKFRALVCLNYTNHMVVNTGNFLHVLRVDLENIKPERQKSPEKQDSSLVDMEQLDVININENEESKAEQYDSLDDKGLTLDSSSVVSPKCDSTITESDFNDEIQCRDRVESEHSINTSSSTQSDYVCDNNKSSISLNDRICNCMDNLQCQCGNSSGSHSHSEQQQAISVRDKILQDFCEDMSQELSIGTDLITLVKHPPCSPRSTPQRLPADLKPVSWSLPILTPPSDILKTRNSESSHKNSSQPSPSQGINVTSKSSPLHSFSLGTTSSSPRLMSPPVTRSFRYYTLAIYYTFNYVLTHKSILLHLTKFSRNCL